MLLLVALSLILAACSADERTRRERGGGGDGISDGGQGAWWGPSISPGSARLRGTVIAIDSGALSDDPANPCSRVPCRATIRVDSVAGYGAGFPVVMAPGESFMANFPFTLRPSREHFPDLREQYPGLDVGATFDADVVYTQVPGSVPDPARDGSLTIYGYRRAE